MKLLCLCLLFATAFAQIQQRCKTTPSLWTALMREINYDARGSEAAFRFARINYDATGQRIKITEYEELESGREEVVYELFLFQEGKYYRAERGGQCAVNELTTPFRPFGIVPQARFMGTEYLGAISGTYGLLVDHFHYTVDRLGGGSYWGSFAPSLSNPSDCYPVLQSYVNEDGPFPTHVNAHFTFLNITATLPDNPFSPPAEC
ncbi:PREDICTED: uncharacterized protein LOC100636616 [Amphimedon queenslandica]|uniref:Mammalian ependymin-related protein 1 n=1 Tax=Amphimedon queenslandica TaxID=400682 RepID=A0A1X7VA15_AMPQE|nr:PREDICTED: uncharacterized protein LOC100636616 [Amphimedon queenslandica]|eukprot:XP_019849855.1 PREDICTED: uncharacterized protein LOC100636616 [Amphimedon queenslandica]